MRHMRPVGAALLLALVQSSSYFSESPAAVSPNIVISQVYGGGGNSGAPFTHDFIELHNRGLTPVSVDGWSLQYGSSGSGGANLGSAADLITPLSGSIQPGKYLLVQEAAGANTTVSALPTPDVTDPTPIAMAAGAGKVALVNTTTPLGCNGTAAGHTSPCSAAALATIVDLVGYGAASFFEGAAPAPAPANAIAALRLNGGAVDTDQNRADFVQGPPNPRNSGGFSTPSLSINDVSVVEGDTVDSIATFTITLSAPATTPVTVMASTQDVSATAGQDYVQALATPVSIGIGERTATFGVAVLADVVIENTEMFEVVLSSPSGATIGDGRGVGTIVNDDLPQFAIHDIQGGGATSPRTGSAVATTGIVTGLKVSGFFLQAADGEVDTDPLTSEGIFVFTRTVPGVAVGDSVRVTGEVQEFHSSSDPTSGSLTEIGGTVGVAVLSHGNGLPAAIDVASFDRTAPSRSAQLERFESMLVQAPSMTVVEPTNRFGEFYAVITGTPRPFRERGIDVSDPLPADAPAGVERFDGNLERVMIEADESVGPTGAKRPGLVLAAGATVTPVYGPLDYGFGEYRVTLDASTPVATTAGATPAPVRAALPSELMVASLNVLNFFPSANTAAARAAFEARVAPIAEAIVADLRTPDILGLIEVGDLDGLRLLRDAVNARAGTEYEAYLLESNEESGNDQDVGYLVNLARVQVSTEPFQVYKGQTFTVCGVTDLLFDRAPFVLEASFDGMPVTVVLNHLRSLIDINNMDPFRPADPACTETVGSRVREKRRLGAELLADLIETRQHDNLIVMGDMNAFEVNDGYGDIIGTIEGSPADPATVVESSVDRWTHELVTLARQVPAAERYSYVHEGSAQVLDHMLVNAAMLRRLTGFTYARLNADIPETLRISDHDGAVGYFMPAADLATATSLPAAITSGSAFSFVVSVTNAGPDRADDVLLTTAIPAGAIFSGAAAPAGWSCTAGATQVSCTAASLDASASATIVMHATAQCDLANQSPLTATTTVTSADDTAVANNGSSATVAISNPAPVIGNARVDRLVLSTPNHQMERVAVAYEVSDNCGAVETALAVRSNEPVNDSGDGNTAPDWEVVDPHTVRLRAERAGGGNGRVYTITITATDAAGNASTQELHVSVPR